MAFYARPSVHRFRQITGDVLVVGWIVAWALMAHQAWQSVMAVAEPARRTAAAATEVRDDFAAAGRGAGGVPLAGEDLRRPFESAAGSLDQVIGAAQDQVRTVEDLALVSGALVFLVPVATVLAFWIPLRVRFIRRSGAVEQLVDSGADLDLFALRAMATQPMNELARISADPVGDWRAGRWPVIVALADLELRTVGLRVPAALRRAVPERFRDVEEGANPSRPDDR